MAIFCCPYFQLGQTYVKIPDVGFKNYLQAKVPSAMNGDSLDITNSLVTTTDSIHVTFAYGVQDLFGAQFFSSLKYLYCSGTGILAAILQKLPPYLPSTLNYLAFPGGGVDSVPPLPNGLKYFDGGGNNIKCFPVFPSSITTINLNYNPYDCLPNYLPCMDSLTLTFPLCQAGNSNGCPLSTASIQSLGYDNQIRLFPLPAHDFIVLDTYSRDKQQVNIYDMNGNRMLKTE